MNYIELFQYTSRKYRNCSLNNLEYITTAKLLAPCFTKERESYDGKSVVVYTVVASAADRNIDLSNAVRDTFTSGGCSHDYDCCGCAHSYATVKRINKRTYRAEVRTYHNY